MSGDERRLRAIRVLPFERQLEIARSLGIETEPGPDGMSPDVPPRIVASSVLDIRAVFAALPPAELNGVADVFGVSADVDALVDAVDGPPPPPRWWRRRGVMGAAAGVAVLSVFLWKVPRCVMKDQHEDHIACVNAIYRTGDGNGAACGASGWLWLPEIVPWLRKEAKQLRADVEYGALESTLELAARRDLDAAATDRAAAALARARTWDTAPKDHFFSTGGQLRDAGALDALIALGRTTNDPGELELALEAALLRGDVDAVRAIAARPSDETSWTWDRSRGFALCWLGDLEPGRAALEAADLDYRKNGYDGFDAARLGIVACGGKREPVAEFRETTMAMLEWFADPSSNRFDDNDYVPAGERMALIAATLGGSQDAVLRTIRRRYSDLILPQLNAGTTWSLLTRPEHDWPYAPKQTHQAATTLAEWAKTARPLPKRELEEVDDLGQRAAFAAPAHHLRWGAYVLEVDAAIAWASRGNLDDARRAATTALELARDPAVDALQPGLAKMTLIPVLDLVGLRAEALALSDEMIAMLVPGDTLDARRMLFLQRAWLLAHDGRFDDARAVLEPVAFDTGGQPRLHGNVRWMHAALTLRAGKASELAARAPSGQPPVPDTIDASPEEMLAYWWWAATHPDAQRNTRWFSRGDVGMLWFEAEAALPAALYIVGAAAGDGDVERWLDIVSGNGVTPHRTMMLARAEAARWRGDTAAADAWTNRIAALDAVTTDDLAAYLFALLDRD